MNWLDLGIAVFVIIFVIVGIKRGLMNSILANFSLGINCLISFFLCRPIKYIIGHWFGLNKAIFGHYYTALSSIEEFNTNLIGLDQNILHDTVSLAINKGNFNFFSKTMFKIFLNKKSLYTTLNESGLESRTMADIVPQIYTNFFTTIIAFLISLVLVFITVKLFQLLVNKLRTVGFVKGVDNTLGALYGVFRCFLVLIVVCTIIKFLSVFSFMNSVISYINGSLFGRFIYAQINDFLNNYLSFSDIIASIFKR